MMNISFLFNLMYVECTRSEGLNSFPHTHACAHTCKGRLFLMHTDITKLNKGKCQVLHLGDTGTDRERSGWRAAQQEETWWCWLTAGSTWVNSVSWQPRGQTAFGDALNTASHPVKRNDFPSVFSIGADSPLNIFDIYNTILSDQNQFDY